MDLDLNKIGEELTNYILNDNDFKIEYNANNQTDNTFEMVVADTVNWVTLEENIGGYFLDKKYIDCSWLVVSGNKILDIDTVWEVFKSYLS